MVARLLGCLGLLVGTETLQWPLMVQTFSFPCPDRCVCGCRFGMRGRLWLLWSTMTFGGLFTCLIGIAGNSFGMTIAFVILAAAGIEV